MKPHPWREHKNFSGRRMLARFATRASILPTVLSLIVSVGVAWFVGFLAVRQFTVRNDSWRKRGLWMILAGSLVFFVLGQFPAYFEAIKVAASSLGHAPIDGAEPFPSIMSAYVRGLALGIALQGLSVIAKSYADEVEGNRFLNRIKPTWRMKRRYKKNAGRLEKNTDLEEGTLAFGVIVDDPIPWRTERYGMVCARPLRELGHGIVVGGNNTGKTVLAVNLASQAAASDWSVFYVDFKASLRTLERVRDMAHRQGRKFYSFDLGIDSDERSWYDPLDWNGTPSDKASMLVNSFQFSEEGDAAYYRAIASEWLTLQFEVLDYIGVYAGESCFDYLLATSSPDGLKERIGFLRQGDENERALLKRWTSEASRTKGTDLTSLRTNLSTVVNAGGNRLRPQNDAPAILMSRAVEEGAVIYFGLSGSTNEVALKIIGSLIIRNLGVLAGERMRSKNLDDLRPILALVDEASRLQHRAVVMENLFATAREGEVYVWGFTQSFSTWPDSTITEMNTNVQTHVAFRVQDTETGVTLSSTLDTISVREDMVEGSVKHRVGRGDVSERSGDTRGTIRGGENFLVDAPYPLTSVENLYAYVWFTGTHTSATIKPWRSRRLPERDTIRSDAPLVRIIFMDMTAPEREIAGPEFTDMVTSPEDISRALENSTIKRRREVTLTMDDNDLPPVPGSDHGYGSASQYAPESVPAAPQWSGGGTDHPSAPPVPQEPQWGEPAPYQNEPQWGPADMEEPPPEDYGYAEPEWSNGPVAPEPRRPHTETLPVATRGLQEPPADDEFAPDTPPARRPVTGATDKRDADTYTETASGRASRTPADARQTESPKPRATSAWGDASDAGDRGNAQVTQGAEEQGVPDPAGPANPPKKKRRRSAADDWA